MISYTLGDCLKAFLFGMVVMAIIVVVYLLSTYGYITPKCVNYFEGYIAKCSCDGNFKTDFYSSCACFDKGGGLYLTRDVLEVNNSYYHYEKAECKEYEYIFK